MIEQLLFDKQLLDKKGTATEYFENYLFKLSQHINWSISAQTGSLTTKTVPKQIIICTNTSSGIQLITLHTPFKDGDEVIIKRQGTGPVSMLASTDGIDGVKTVIVFVRRYDAPHLIATKAAGEWNII